MTVDYIVGGIKLPDSDFDLMMSDVGFVQDSYDLAVPEPYIESEEDNFDNLMDEDWRTNGEQNQ